MAIIVKLLDLKGEPVDQYLKRYDLEAHDGRGEVEGTNNPDHAIRFDNVPMAIDWCTRVSTTKPTREDGKPNRPLTAFTLAFVEVEAAQQTRPPRSRCVS